VGCQAEVLEGLRVPTEREAYVGDRRAKEHVERRSRLVLGGDSLRRGRPGRDAGCPVAHDLPQCSREVVHRRGLGPAHEGQHGAALREVGLHPGDEPGGLATDKVTLFVLDGSKNVVDGRRSTALARSTASLPRSMGLLRRTLGALPRRTSRRARKSCVLARRTCRL
jgi:hypothetical protein